MLNRWISLTQLLLLILLSKISICEMEIENNFTKKIESLLRVDWLDKEMFSDYSLENAAPPSEIMKQLNWRELNYYIKNLGLRRNSTAFHRQAWRNFVYKNKKGRRLSKRSHHRYDVEQFEESFIDKILYFLGIKKRTTTTKKTTLTPRPTRRNYPVRGWIHVTNGTMPHNAFVGNVDFEGISYYVGRGRIPAPPGQILQLMLPGYLFDGENCVRVAYENWGRCLGDYDILVGNFRWVPMTNGSIHPDSIIGGAEEGEDVFVCRRVVLAYERTIVIGKGTLTGCYTWYPEGLEGGYTEEYDALVGNYENPKMWNESRIEHEDIRLPGEAASVSED